MPARVQDMQQKRTRLLDMRKLRHCTPKAVLFATRATALAEVWRLVGEMRGIPASSGSNCDKEANGYS